MNIGWTIGEEILFRGENGEGRTPRTDTCRSMSEAGVLGIEKKNLSVIKRALQERGLTDEFVKIEILLRGNNLVKQRWL